MNEINEIKIPKGVDRIAVKQHEDRIVFKFIPEEAKFKRGDIIVPTANPRFIAIFDKVTSPTTFDSIYHNGFSSNKRWILARFRHATKEEKQEFFDELKADGKWWNAEKLIVEDIPKFKEGDFVYEDGRIMIVKNYPDNYYALIYPKLDMKPVYNRRYAPIMPLSSLSFRCATEDEKKLLIDALKKDGKRWNAERMKIENIPQPKFKVGDAVRIKNGISSKTHGHTGPKFLKSMDECVGKKFIIDEIGDNADFGFYYSVRGNRWSYSEDWLEPYVEELKKGDLAIFWGEETLPDGDAIIARYNCADIIDWAISHHSADGGVYNFAVKWDGTKEQFEKVLRGEI